jgi:UDP-N-acetylmuramyl pentapeptide synthase
LQDTREYADVTDAARLVGELLAAGDVVLLKASRAMRLETLGEVIRSSHGVEPFSNAPNAGTRRDS